MENVISCFKNIEENKLKIKVLPFKLLMQGRKLVKMMDPKKLIHHLNQICTSEDSNPNLLNQFYLDSMYLKKLFRRLITITIIICSFYIYYGHITNIGLNLYSLVGRHSFTRDCGSIPYKDPM